MRYKLIVPWMTQVPVGLRRRISAAAITLCLLTCEQTAVADFSTVVEHGPSSNRVNTFFLGDGYTALDLAAGTYAEHVQNCVNYMFANNIHSDPFYRYRNFFNIYRVEVVSNQSGADEPQNGVDKDTALNATYRYDGATDRLLYISDSKADAALNSAITGSGKPVQMRFVTVNNAIYGGGGGKYSVYAGANSSASDVALHEMAHSFSNLADEYGGNTGTYSGSEPSRVNVTKDPSGAKWSRWLHYNDPTGSVVGAYEGGLFYDHGIFRPTSDSKMRSLNEPFNAIGREKLILDIYGIVDPLDSFIGNTSILVDPALLSVTRVDDAVIRTQWFIDGNLQPGFDGQSAIALAALALSPGPHSVSVRAYDPTGFDPIAGWVRMDTSRLEQFVHWDIFLSLLPGDFNRDGQVSAADIATMLTALADLNTYQSERNLSDANLLTLGDLDADGQLTNTDVQGLLNVLLASGGSLTAVPEPVALTLAALAIVLAGLLQAGWRLKSDVLLAG